jgi:hypothetical protein
MYSQIDLRRSLPPVERLAPEPRKPRHARRRDVRGQGSAVAADLAATARVDPALDELTLRMLFGDR